MRYYLSQLPKLIDNIKSGNINAVLLYGKDKTIISNLVQQIARETNSSIREIYYDTPDALLSTLNSGNLFDSKELVKILDHGLNISKETKTILDSIHNNFPVFIEDELGPNASIRKFFESHSKLGIIPCYPDDINNVKAMILEKFKSKKITSEALKLLAESIKGDRGIIKHETEKLYCYAVDHESITKGDVINVVGQNIISTIDILPAYFAKNTQKYFLELDKLMTEGINEINIIRTLLRYYINIYNVLLQNRCGKRIEDAVHNLIPPLLFLYIRDFIEVASSSTIKEVSNVLLKLYIAEKNYKRGVPVLLLHPKLEYEHTS